MSEFHITSPILQAAFFGNHYCENSKLVINGYINNDKHKLARAFLSYCTEVIFNIRRLPGFEEEYRLAEGRHYFETFSVLNQSEVNETIEELKALYEHTQASLAVDQDVINGKLILKRSLAPFERKHVALQLFEKKQQIEYYSNIITSYKSNGGLYEYGSPMLLTREVEVEKILMHYRYLKYPGNSCSGDSREFEVLVVNSNPFGRELFSNTNFTYDVERFSPDEMKREFKFGYFDQNRLENKFLNLDTITDTYCQRPLIKKILKLQRFFRAFRGR